MEFKIEDITEVSDETFLTLARSGQMPADRIAAEMQRRGMDRETPKAAQIPALPMPDVKGLVERSRIKAGMLRMGEPIAFGTDADLIEEQATALTTLSAKLSAAEAENARLRGLIEVKEVELESAKRFGGGFFGEQVKEHVRDVYRQESRTARSAK